jgi:hypothetical protein
VGSMTVFFSFFLTRYQESEEQLCGEKTKRPAQELGCLSVLASEAGWDFWALFRIEGLFESTNQRSGGRY